MKTLNQYLRESILDDEEDIISSAPEVLVKDFISKNYNVKESYLKIKKSNDKYIVDCNITVAVSNLKIEQLTNELFTWGEVESFYCDNCNSLKSLEGSPKEVGRDFNCGKCNSLTSLEGAPKEVGRDFYCGKCNSLTSLEGAPKEVGDWFDCHGCKSLESLQGAPKEVKGNFYCYGCKIRFTKEDVKKESKVKGEIYA